MPFIIGNWLTWPSQGLFLGVEGTVMAGTLSCGWDRDLLARSGITRIAGILNGTTNYVLTEMRAGSTYEAALAEARRRVCGSGPDSRVEGYDAAVKIAILANQLLGGNRVAEVRTQGISRLTPQDIAAAESADGVLPKPSAVLRLHLVAQMPLLNRWDCHSRIRWPASAGRSMR
ncbi:MAG: hypothetical protein R3C44_15165 [Chloroflexota bacterium]